MYKMRKVVASLLLAVLVLFSLPLVGLCEGTTMIKLSKSSVDVGSSVTVTVTASASSSITVKYNTSVLNFNSCDTSYRTSGNTVVFNGTSANISFIGAAEGTSNIVVSGDALTGSSTTVTVGTTSSSDNTDSDEETTTTETSSVVLKSYGISYTASSDSDADYTIDGEDYVLSERFSTGEIPSGFAKKSITIHNKSIGVVSNDNLTLVYLKLASNTAGSGVFYLYDETSDSVSDLVMLGEGENAVILENPDSMLSASLYETTYVGDEFSCKAYQLTGGSNGFYYFYGLGSDGTANWYSYDSEYKTMQRVNADLFAETTVTESTEVTEEEATPEEDEEETFSFDLSSITDKLDNKTIMAILIFIVVLVAVIIINVLLFKKTDDDVFDEDDDDEFEDSLEEFSDEDEEEDEEEEDRPRGGFFSRRRREQDIFDEDEPVRPAFFDTEDDEEELPTIQSVTKEKRIEEKVERVEKVATSREGKDENLASKKLDVLDFNDL